MLSVQGYHHDAAVQGEHPDLGASLLLVRAELRRRDGGDFVQGGEFDGVVEVERGDDERPKKAGVPIVGEIGGDLITNARVVDFALVDLLDLLVVPAGHVLWFFDEVDEFARLEGHEVVIRVSHAPLHCGDCTGHVGLLSLVVFIGVGIELPDQSTLQLENQRCGTGDVADEQVLGCVQDPSAQSGIVAVSAVFA